MRTGLRELFTPVFAGMMDRGLLRRDDPSMLAFAYTAPISALIHFCDREPDKTEEAMAQIEAFSRHFIKAYGGMDHDCTIGTDSHPASSEESTERNF